MALIPPYFMDCVVAIGQKEGETDSTPKWIASGFLYGRLMEKGQDPKDNTYHVFLVSNRHVFERKEQLCLRFNPQAKGEARSYDVDLKSSEGRQIWTANPDKAIDVGVMPINVPKLREHGMKAGFFTSDMMAAGVSKMKELGLTEGDFSYVLGFPMGMAGQQRNAVIVRSGCIARIQEALNADSNTFLVDAEIFPGNSGGPVVSKPDALAIQGTKPQNAAFLIGIVAAYVPYREAAVSPQTGRPRVIFEENSGLAVAHTVDCIERTIDQSVASEPPSAKPSNG